MKYQPLSSSLFTGRDDLLNALEDFFTDQGPGQHLRREYLLFGMGGAGKTQIALKFAESYQQKQVHMDSSYVRITDQSRTGTTTFSGLMQAIEILLNRATKI